MHVVCLVTQLCLFATLWYVAPLSVGFFRQGHWSGLLFSSPGDLPDPEIESTSPALSVDSLPAELSGEPL